MIIEIGGIPHAVIIYASDCDPCPYCDEPVCPICLDHYADCECPGPNSEPEEIETEQTINYMDALQLDLL